MTWQDRAACRTMPDGYTRAEWTAIFYVTSKKDPKAKAAADVRAAYCGGCPVRAECEAAGKAEDFGWWGGVECNPGEIGRAEHGTASGYNAHLRYKNTPCDACREANTIKSARLRDAQRNGVPVRRREAECGTESGWNKHVRLGEKPCIACHEARTQARRERERRARERVEADA